MSPASPRCHRLLKSRTSVYALVLLLLRAAPAEAQVAVAWDEAEATRGATGILRSRSPWAFAGRTITGGPDAVLHSAHGRLYVLSRKAGTVTVLRRRAVRVFELGAESEPEDIAVASPTAAWITLRRATSLLRLDLRTGATAEVVDLSPFADGDGIPDLGAMIVHEGRLFVQIRRMNEDAPGGLAPPGYLAVVDLVSEQLVDVDPETAGVQAIELEGTAPKSRMQIVGQTRQLFVSATGGFFDAGGIEVIDLDTLRTTGLVVREADGQTGADLGAFVMTTPERGYLVYSTDLDLSSHLKPFSLSGGVEPGPEMHVSVGYFVPTLVHDASTGFLFVPDGAFGRQGVLVFDTATNDLLTAVPRATAGPPTDLIGFTRGRR